MTAGVESSTVHQLFKKCNGTTARLSADVPTSVFLSPYLRVAHRQSVDFIHKIKVSLCYTADSVCEGSDLINVYSTIVR